MQSAIVYGLSAALREQITFDKGRVQQTNFHQYQPLRMDEMPVVEVHIVPSTAATTGHDGLWRAEQTLERFERWLD
jgi:isoquinoline 1-oxidoreductase beta subunit